MKRTSRNDIIACPCCGAEYTAGEIFVPQAFIGVPKYLEKEGISHKIMFDAGKPMDTTEFYICDYCDTKFKITANVRFFTQIDEKSNFVSNYVTILEKNNLFKENE